MGKSPTLTRRSVGCLKTSRRSRPHNKRWWSSCPTMAKACRNMANFLMASFFTMRRLRIPWIVTGQAFQRGTGSRSKREPSICFPRYWASSVERYRPASQGSSLLPALTGKPVDTTYSYAETLYPKINMGWAELRGIRTSKWKYIRAPRSELYDLETDPGETRNVFESHRNEAQRLEGELARLTATGEGKPAERVGMKSINPRPRSNSDPWATFRPGQRRTWN